MKKTIVLLAFVLSVCSFNSLFAQSAPIIAWQKNIGGSSLDGGGGSIATSDGGSITYGQTQSFDADAIGNQGGWSILLVKLDSTGTILWEKTIGGSNHDELSARLIQTISGGYAIVFATYSSWSGDINDTCWGSSDVAFCLLDSVGMVLSEHSFGGSLTENPVGLIQLPSGAFVVIAQSESNDGDVSGGHGSYDYWALKLDANGNLLSQKTFGGTANDSPWDAIYDSDNKITIFGHTYSTNGDVSFNHGILDWWLVEIDTAFNLIREKTFGGTNPDYGIALAQVSDGGYVLAGHSQSNNGDVGHHYGPLGYNDIWAVRLDSSLNIVWEKNLGGTNTDETGAILNQGDTTFIISGYTMSNDSNVSGLHGIDDIWIVALDQSGKICWQKCIGGTGDDYQEYGGQGIVVTANGGYFVTGTSHSNDGDVSDNYGSSDIWVIKLQPEIVPDTTDTTNIFVSATSFSSSIDLYPNPATDWVTISSDVVITGVALYDSGGRIVFESHEDHAISQDQKILLADLVNGYYFCKVTTKISVKIVPIVLMR